MICLDTNAVIAVISGRSPSVRIRLEAALTENEQITVPAIVLFELWFGIAKSQRVEANIKALDAFLSKGFDVLPFDAQDAREAGDIRAALAVSGMSIGPYDVLIAAQARRRNARLITANGREFVRVPRPTMEDWAMPITGS